MKLFKALVLASLFFSASCFAGFAQLTPPPSWSAGAMRLGSAIASNEATFAGGTVLTNAALSVGGQSVVVPASMRLAANAGSIMAKGISLNPWILGASVAAPLLWDYYKSLGIDITGSDASNMTITKTVPGSGCVTPGNGAAYNSAWCADAGYGSRPTKISWGPSDGWCRMAVQCDTGGGYVTVTTGYGSVSNTASTQQISPQELEPLLNPPAGLPDFVPKHWPDPLPMTSPVINPNTAPTPASQPLTVPQGLPVPVPNSNPQQYKSPVVDIVPAPTPSNPWQVDIQTRDVVSTDPTPLTSPNSTPTKPATPDPAPTDSALPELPKLYTPKYPDGLTGVWTTKKAVLTNSPLLHLIPDLMPRLGSSAGYPSFPFAVVIGPWNFGSYDLSPSSYVWDFIKFCVLLTTAFFVRSVIFGG